VGRAAPGGVAYATRVRAGLELRELDADEFLANLQACTSVYAAAMGPPEYQLPGRHSVMERHAGYSAFRAVAAVRGPPDGQAAPGEPRSLIGFAYGFHGADGQWWHDLVSQAVERAMGRQAAADWLADSFEIAEVHVLPGHQGQGTGLAMMLRLTAGRPERTAVLSTMDAETRARRLYRGLGFTDLLAGFAFAGTEEPYAIMGAPLPLRDASPRPPRPESPSRW
jgi:ribosomal protein S18 acetylase RimI-like enzyme